MCRTISEPGAGERDLHALVDGISGADRHMAAVTYLALRPDAAERFSSFRQRVALAALREGLAAGEPAAGLAGPEAALRLGSCDAIAPVARWRVRSACSRRSSPPLPPQLEERRGGSLPAPTTCHGGW